MHTKVFVFLAAILALISSCRKALDTKLLTTSSETLSKCAKVNCPAIDIAYVRVLGEHIASDKINAEIQEYIIQSLYIGEEENGSDALGVENAMEDFIELYRIHSAEFPGLSTAYFAEISVVKTFSSKDLLSVHCQNYLYTGGAHGYGSVTYKNFDPKSGALLYYEDVFDNVSQFEVFAEKTFRQQNNISQGDGINATGFWFEDDTFYLPETFGISKDFITLHYNPYEIASYAAGPIVIEIPIAEVKDLLKIKIE